MQKEMSAAAEEGFVYKGQTVFESAFGGREVGVVMERDPARGAGRDEYLLGSYADFLLDQQRNDEVIRLLGEETRSDPLLLRLTIAEHRFGVPRSVEHRRALRLRLGASRLRGAQAHLREEA